MEGDSDESEWEIQEYSPCIKEGNNDKTGIVKWMLNNGYVIGKNMVITGIVIASAPIPLVVFSAMGFAFSVPFGLVFASYACTNKIMSTLLPIPPSPSPSPLMLEYYTHEYEQEKCLGVESRFELDDGGDDYRQIDGAEISYLIDEYDDDGGGEVKDLVANVDWDFDEERYYIDEGGNEEDEIGPENAVEEEDNEQMEDLNQGVDIVFELDEGSIMNVVENVDVGSNHANENVDDKEIEDHSPQRENVAIEDEEKEQVKDINHGVTIFFELNEGGDDYGKQGEASIMNVDENVYEQTSHANENVDEKEMEDHVFQRENVVIEEEENEQIEDIEQGVDIVFDLGEGGNDCEKQGEASIMNVDEGSNLANEYVDKKEMEDHVPQRENFVIEEEEKEQKEDVNQGVAIIVELDEGGDDYGKQVEASIMNVDDFVKGGGNHVNENVDEEMEDHVPQSENLVIEVEEKEQMEDIKQGVEMRLSLEMSGEDQGYEEDVGEYLEGDGDSIEDENKGEELLTQSQTDEHRSNTWEAIVDEMEEKVEGGNVLSENITDERNAYNMVEDDYLLDESALVFEDARDVERTEPVMVKEIDSQKLIMDGSTNNEMVVGEMRHIVILAEGNEENNFNAKEVEELDLLAREVMGDTNKKPRNAQSDEEVMRESMGTQEEETGGYTSNDGSDEAISGTKTEHLIHIYADAREIGDESGLDLFDERNANIQFTSLEADDEGKENIADENVDFMALPAFKRLPLAMDNGKAATKTKTNTKMPSREDCLDEERIWEKIGAMRTIVGYKTPSQATCIGELKALYVFTGVEPAATFKDNLDLDEANAKLKFLMSIVGVK